MTLTVTYLTSTELFKDVVYWDFNKVDFLTIQTPGKLSLIALENIDRIDVEP